VRKKLLRSADPRVVDVAVACGFKTNSILRRSSVMCVDLSDRISQEFRTMERLAMGKPALKNATPLLPVSALKCDRSLEGSLIRWIPALRINLLRAQDSDTTNVWTARLTDSRLRIRTSPIARIE